MLLVRLYPAAWRARYGAELEALIAEASAGGRVPWRTRADVVRAAARERAHALLGGSAPDRVRASASVVLWAWAAFVVAGIGVQKYAEHWQSATPSGSRALPGAAFDALAVTAAVGSALVLGGIAATLPRLLEFLRGGGWPRIRRPVTAALALATVLVPATIGLVLWAHRLTEAQRNGHDGVYAGVAAAWAVLVLATLLAWTRAATATAAHLDLAPAVLRLEARLAGAVAVAMAVMTAATAVWWGSLAAAGAVSSLAPQLVVAGVLMLLATVVAAGAALRGLRTA
jgi:hypothetical protein